MVRSVIVRVATPEDVTAASRQEPAGANIAVSHFARQEAGDATYLVAREEQEVLGNVLVVGTELRHLQVNESARGQGLGTALIRAAEDVLAEQGHTEATIGVGLDNARARALYLRLGYVPTGHTETTTYTYVDDDGRRRKATETDELLRKDLPA